MQNSKQALYRLRGPVHVTTKACEIVLVKAEHQSQDLKHFQYYELPAKSFLLVVRKIVKSVAHLALLKKRTIGFVHLMWCILVIL
ncbi:Uncharacterised protein [Chlamydia trachomatis]|nr:Uncharacterised protein [Chlamydia trachomatis]